MVALALLAEIVAARGELLGPAPEAWYDRLEREESLLNESLREAEQSDSRLGLEAAALLSQFWFHRGRVDLGRRWLSELLAAAPAQPSAERARALRAAGGLAFRQADNEVAKTYERAALEMARTLERRDIEAEALVGLARTGLRDGDPGVVLEYARQARDLAAQLGDETVDLQGLHCAAEATRMSGRLDEARTLYMESLERNRARGASVMVAVELNNLAFLEKAAGHLEIAERNLVEAISISLSTKNAYLLAHHLVALAAVCAAAGRGLEAAQLLGKAESLFDEAGLSLDPADEPERDAATITACRLLGDDEFNASHAAGKDLDPAIYVRVN
jgi:tetratricopeptide (TPR) repeat protein